MKKKTTNFSSSLLTHFFCKQLYFINYTRWWGYMRFIPIIFNLRFHTNAMYFSMYKIKLLKLNCGMHCFHPFKSNRENGILKWIKRKLMGKNQVSRKFRIGEEFKLLNLCVYIYSYQVTDPPFSDSHYILLNICYDIFEKKNTNLNWNMYGFRGQSFAH